MSAIWPQKLANLINGSNPTKTNNTRKGPFIVISINQIYKTIKRSAKVQEDQSNSKHFSKRWRERGEVTSHKDSREIDTIVLSTWSLNLLQDQNRNKVKSHKIIFGWEPLKRLLNHNLSMSKERTIMHQHFKTCHICKPKVKFHIPHNKGNLHQQDQIYQRNILLTAISAKVELNIREKNRKNHFMMPPNLLLKNNLNLWSEKMSLKQIPSRNLLSQLTKTQTQEE